VVEETAEADGEDKVAEKGVVYADEQERAGALVGEGKKQTADGAEGYSDPVAQNDVGEAEGYGAGHEHSPAGAEKGLVTMEEESAVEKLLGKDGQEGVEDHDEGPETRRALDEGKKQLRGKETDSQAEQDKENCVSQKERLKLGTHSPKGEEIRRIEGAVTAQDEIGNKSNEKKVWNWKIGQDAEVDEHREGEEEEKKLQGEQDRVRHGAWHEECIKKPGFYRQGRWRQSFDAACCAGC
jgi:hypothetical protein